MDRKSWPWKKKSSDKQSASATPLSPSDSHAEKPVKEDKKPKHVQISVESYTHLTGLEDQVKSYEDQVQALEDEIRELNEKLTEANSDITLKESLVKQHTKVAEEAVSGWEKADEEAAALKNHLESVTLLKLAAEERAQQLDGAVKECMRQIRLLKEEHALQLQEFAVTKANQFDKMKAELEARLFDLDQELLRAAAENAALSRSLQERCNLLIRVTEEKSQAEAEIERLRSNIEASEKEANSLKYEVHIARKEADIRNEEKNMSVRSAEVASRQHIEAVKKIAKLEAECQRLRGLVRKKLPGPAALAQMKLEVESLGRENGESRSRRLSGKPSSPASDLSLENASRYIKENEMLTERMMVMEEETKMLQDALAKRNSELQAARSMYHRAAGKLQGLEAELEAGGEQRRLLKSAQIQNGGIFHAKNEDGIEDNASTASSWSTGMLSELSHLKRERNAGVCLRTSGSTKNLDLMDDFLEMEKLAFSDADIPDKRAGAGAETVKDESGVLQERCDSQARKSLSDLQSDPLVALKLKSFITSELESMMKENDQGKIAENVQHLLQGIQELKSGAVAAEQELKAAAARVCDFIRILGRETKQQSADGAALNAKIDLISAKYQGIMENDINPVDFILDVSDVLSEASKLPFTALGFNMSESETSSSDCIDKIALPENKAVDSMEERYPNGNGIFPDTCSEDGSPVPKAAATPWKCSLEEFEQLKVDKDNLVAELARCMENFEATKLHLKETEHLLAEAKSQLSSSLKSNGLADTQLKCMAESYKSLETRAEDLQVEVNRLQGRIECLESELLEARQSHEEAVDRCRDLQEQLERIEDSAAAVDEKTSQEKELAAAAEKLSECQETINLLGKQLKSLRTQPEGFVLTSNGKSMHEEESNMQEAESLDIDTGSFLKFHRAGQESPLFEPYHAPMISPDATPSRAKHQSSSSSTPEKQARGFSRFFSSSSSTKGKVSQW